MTPLTENPSRYGRIAKNVQNSVGPHQPATLQGRLGNRYCPLAHGTAELIPGHYLPFFVAGGDF
jgi:hypothetical protein